MIGRWIWHVKFMKRKRAAASGGGASTAGEPIGLLLALTKAS